MRRPMTALSKLLRALWPALALPVLAPAQVPDSASGSLPHVRHFNIAGEPVAGARLWLYLAGWGRMQRLLLAEVEAGSAHPGLQSDALQALCPSDNCFDQLWVVLETAEGHWRHSGLRRPAPDSSGKWSTTNILAQLPVAIDTLGVLDSRTATIALAPPVTRTLWLQHPDGSAAAGVAVRIEPFASTSNHCGTHMSFAPAPAELPVHRSDASGRIRFEGPLQALMLHTTHYERVQRTGRELWMQSEAVALAATTEIHLRTLWVAPKPQRLQLTLVDHAGAAVIDRAVHAAFATTGCGINSGEIGRSDHQGGVSLNLALATVERIWIEADGSNGPLRELSTRELETLAHAGKLRLTLPTADHH